MNKIVLIGIIVLSLTAVIWGGYYYSKHKNSDESLGVLNTTNPPTETPVTQPNEEDISDQNGSENTAPQVNKFTVDELWTVKDQYLGKEVIVKGTVRLLASCPSAEGSTDCSTNLFLGELSGNYFQLYQNGSAIKCPKVVNSCLGFEQGKLVEIKGIPGKNQSTPYFIDIKP